MLDVCYYAHYLHPRITLIDLQALSDRVFIGPVATDHRFIDYSNCRSLCVVALGKGTTLRDRYSHRSKVVGTYHPVIGARAIAGAIVLKALDRQPTAAVARCQR